MTGNPLPPATACFTFDNMGEAADVGAGAAVVVAPNPPHPSLSIGFPNLYRLLDCHRVRATFFIEGWNGAHHPDAVAEVAQRGHELGMHGWTHESWAGLEREQEAELAAQATAALTRASGVRPRGFRAPGGARSPHTEAILAELGYRYDASLGDGVRPQRLSSGLAQIPFVWAGVDGAYYLAAPPADPTAVRDGWLRALARTAETGGVFVLICHAFITGVDAARLGALEAVIEAACADERVAVRTMGEVAEIVLAQA